MIRPTRIRPVILFVTLLSLFVSACSSGSENARSTNAANVSTVSTPPANTASGATNQSTGNQTASNAAKAKLNVNTASANDLLTTIPGMGDRMVHEFEEYRPYKSIQQFRREIGKYVKPEQIVEYEKYIYVPISVNDADAPTLQQIPGLDATEAQALMAARPYASNDAFLAKLAANVSDTELAVAKTYLNNQ